jgi:O-antigen ligase
LPSEPLLALFAVLVGFYILLYFNKIKEKILNSKLFFFIALHLFWTYVTTVFSSNVIVSIKTSVVKTMYIFAFYIGTIIIINQIQKIKKMVWLIWLPALLTIIYVFRAHAVNNFSFESINAALSPVYRNHVNYGVFIAMLLPYTVYLHQQYQRYTLPKLFVGISIAVALAAIYFSYTRGAWLAVLLMPVYAFIIKKKWTKPILMLMAAAIISFFIYLFHNNTYLKYAPDYKKTITHTELASHLNSTIELEDISTMERFYRWLAAVKMSKHYWLHGVGAGNFTENYKPYTVAAYQTYVSDNKEKSTVHNYFLLILTEQGFPGFIIFTLLIIYLLIYAEKLYHQQQNPKNKLAIILITLSIFVFLVNNTLSDFMETNKVGSLFWISAGLLSLFDDKNNSNGLQRALQTTENQR